MKVDVEALKAALPPRGDLTPGRTHFHDSDELCAYVRHHTGPVVTLSFSLGKDSAACWVQLRKYFATVVPIYRYIVPGLRFVEENLRYYEEFFGTKIHRFPNESLIWMIDQLAFQPPYRITNLANRTLYRDFEPAMATWDVAVRAGAPGAFNAVGVRAADSMHRRIRFERQGTLDYEIDSFSPVYDWNQARMVEEFTAAGLKLPTDYRIWNRSFDSCRFRFLGEIREKYPDDYAKILRWFPLIEAEFKRREYAKRKP